MLLGSKGPGYCCVAVVGCRAAAICAANRVGLVCAYQPAFPATIVEAAFGCCALCAFCIACCGGAAGAPPFVTVSIEPEPEPVPRDIAGARSEAEEGGRGDT